MQKNFHFAIKAIYETLLLLGTVIFLPRVLFLLLRRSKKIHKQRLGIGYPQIAKTDAPLIWVHAVSVGETKAVAPLVKRIRRDFKNAVILFSSVTATGHAEAKRSVSEADHYVFLPLDFFAVVDPIVKKLNPSAVVLCETDFWWNFLRCCKKQNAAIFLVNGKLSTRSLQWYKKLSWFSSRLFEQITTFCVQSEQYKNRFLDLNIPKDKIVVTGNMKFDDGGDLFSPEERRAFKVRLGLKEDHLVLVVGSTHAPEETLILETLEKIWKSKPKLTVILAPRHPERFDAIAAIIKQKKLPFNRFSQQRYCQDAKIILLDTMGQLRHCYQLADVAIVGGSFTAKIGGHNILEPLQYGTPVVFGPHMHAQQELEQIVTNYQAGIQVKSESLSATLNTLFDCPQEREKLGVAGKKLFVDLKGGVVKTYETIRKALVAAVDQKSSLADSE